MTDGADFECVACHQVKRDDNGNLLSHGIGDVNSTQSMS